MSGQSSLRANSRVMETAWAILAVTAAFGTYFCMYGFRKPFTVSSYEGSVFWDINFKTLVVSVQVIGYMISKFIGIKVISEMPPNRRAFALLGLIGIAEAGLALFGILPRPWNVVGLFVNGLALGMVFGLVLGFLEGRRVTEALVAGLCTSFILADGITKSVGRWLLDLGVVEDWMPFTAGLVFLLPLIGFVSLLSLVPPPDQEDVEERSARHEMTRADRWALFHKYALGLTMLVGMFLLVTVVRSVRADFAPELWSSLNYEPDASTYGLSELYVGLGVILVSGLAVLVRNNRQAFFISLGICAMGFAIIAVTLFGLQAGVVDPFSFMVLIGIGLYLPYVAVHTTVFERMLAMTREKGNLGFLMYLADAYGYLGYVIVMFTRDAVSGGGNFLTFFTGFCWVTVGLSAISLVVAWRYFQGQRETVPVTPAVENAA